MYDLLEQLQSDRKLYDKISKDEHHPLYCILWTVKDSSEKLQRKTFQSPLVRLRVVPIRDSRASETRARVKITPREKGETRWGERKTWWKMGTIHSLPLVDTESFKNYFAIRLCYNYDLVIWLYFNCNFRYVFYRLNKDYIIIIIIIIIIILFRTEILISIWK